MSLSELINSSVSWVLKSFYKFLYHQFANYYDLVSGVVSVGLWSSWVKTALQYLPGPLVLEIGHGPGHLLRDLQLSGIRAFGLDESSQMSALARINLKKTNCPAFLINGLAQSLPFRNSTFHQVAATFPADFILNKDTLNGIHRVLIPGGALIIIPAAWLTSKKWSHRIAAWLFRVTMQTPKNSIDYARYWKQILHETAFQVDVFYHELRSSRVMVIIARKSK